MGSGFGLGMRLAVWCSEETPWVDSRKVAAQMTEYPEIEGRSPMDVARESTAGADLVLKLLDQAEAGVAV